MRLFIAIPLPENVVHGLSAACARLRSDRDSLRWSAPESWHITLQFLGNSTEEQLACLTTQLAQVRPAPVPVRLGGLGVFDRAGVFFAEVEVTPQLAALQSCVVAATAHCGFVPEDRPYHPHITLARAKGDSGRGAIKKLKQQVSELASQRAGARTFKDFPAFTAREFLLYESHLGPGGSKYEVRASFPLL